MEVTITIADERLPLIQRQAEARGLTAEKWLLEIAEQNTPVPSI